MDKIQARKHMLKALKEEMKKESRNDLKKLLPKKKGMEVSVMADSPEGLKKGLDLAEDLMEGSESEDSKEEDCEMCEGEGCEHCEGEDSPLKPVDKEAIKKKISGMME